MAQHVHLWFVAQQNKPTYFADFFGTGIPGVIVLIAASSAHDGYGTNSR